MTKQTNVTFELSERQAKLVNTLSSAIVVKDNTSMSIPDSQLAKTLATTLDLNEEVVNEAITTVQDYVLATHAAFTSKAVEIFNENKDIGEIKAKTNVGPLQYRDTYKRSEVKSKPETFGSSNRIEYTARLSHKPAITYVDKNLSANVDSSISQAEKLFAEG